MEPKGGRRRDAEANRRAVLDAAAALLSKDPDASITEIAERTGLGRTTVYRHFSNRTALFEGLAEEVVRQGDAGVEAAVAHDPETAAVLRAVAAMNVELGMRYPFLFAHQAVTKPALQRASRGGDASPSSWRVPASAARSVPTSRSGV